jgi:2-hydroxyacyl-CoA lyase 1
MFNIPSFPTCQSLVALLLTSPRTGLPFLPTPMGKGVVPDSDPHNTSSARSTALKESDVILVLGARLNWILHYGEPPKWNEAAKIIQVDISAEELGRNSGDSRLSIFGDIGLAIDELVSQLAGWQWQSQSQLSTFQRNLQASKAENEAGAARKARVDKIPMTFERVFDVIKTTLHRLSVPENGDIVYISEGSNTMDISRSIFTVEHPRLRLDAGTYATMGVGLGYAIAAHAAFNNSQPEATSGQPGRKKVVAIEGDSSFGFSAMEVETMARYEMDVLIFVINNSGIYHGDSHSADQWLSCQRATAERATANGAGLRSLSLGYEVGYEKIAETCGGIGFLARTPAELERATEEGYKAKVPVIVNVIIEPGDDKIMVSLPTRLIATTAA